MEGKDNNFKEFRKHHNHRGGASSALILLSIGTVLLLNNFGVIDWNIWETLWKFWPLILIFAGFREISENSKLLNLVLGLISLVMVISAIIYSLALTNSGFRNWLETNYPIWTKIIQILPKETVEIKTV